MNFFCTKVKNPKADDMVEQVHQAIYNMIFTNDLSNIVFDCMTIG